MLLTIMALWTARVTTRASFSRFFWGHSPEHGDFDMYMVLVQFDAVRSGADLEQVTLVAQVSRELWKCLSRRGTEVTVRYATEDPSIALLEGEAGFSPNGDSLFGGS